MKGFFARYNTRPCDCQKRKMHFLFYGTAGQNSICFLVNLAGDQTESEKKKSGILVIEIWKAGKGLVLFHDSWY